jgi:hypothetical protein
MGERRCRWKNPRGDGQTPHETQRDAGHQKGQEQRRQRHQREIVRRLPDRQQKRDRSHIEGHAMMRDLPIA